MVKIIWNNKEYPVLNNLTIKKSSRITTFNDISIDFEDGTIEDMPMYLQEVQIVDGENVLFTGYVDEIKCPELRANILNDKVLQLTLLSPRQLSTKRCVTINKSDNILDIIRLILNPLVDDGFTIKEINIPNKYITVQYISRTVEECMNLLSNKYSIWWYIDEKKNIYVYSIEYLLNKTAKKEINIENYTDEIIGLEKITPTVEGTEYANIINLKNARIYYRILDYSELIVKENDTVVFENPIDTSYSSAQRNVTSKTMISAFDNLDIWFYYNDDETQTRYRAQITSYLNTSPYSTVYVNIGKKDEENELFTAIYDTMFSTLITGLKYNGTRQITIDEIQSETALRYSTIRLSNWQQIKELKGTITPSGQIEKTINANEKWFTIDEAVEYISSMFMNNDKSTNKITMYCDNDNDIKIGDKFIFNLPSYLTEGTFIVTDINEIITNDSEYIIELRNTNLLDNYINLFRATISEEQESQINTEYVIEYDKSDNIIESTEIINI